MTNRSNQPIGADNDGDATGIRVFFSGFKNIDASADLRTLTRLSTITGGVEGYNDGALGLAQFKRPASVAVANDGTIYVADTDNNRVRKIANGQVSTLAGSGSSTSVDGVGVAATTYRPYGIGIGPDGYIYVTELLGRRVRRISPAGVMTTIAGTGSAGAADGIGSTATFNAPEGLAIGSDGSIYIADSFNHKIRKILPPIGDPRLASSYTVTTLAGTGSSGFGDGIGTAAVFNTPRAVTVADDGTVYVADRLNHRIRRISPGGEVVTIVGKGVVGSLDGLGDVANMAHPGGITVSGDALFFFDGGTKKIRQAVLRPGQAPGSPVSWKVSTLAGTGATGLVDGTGDVAQTSGFGSVAFSDGSVYFADGSNNAIRLLTANVGLPIPDSGGSTTAEKVTLVDADGVEVASLPNAYQTETPYLRYSGALESGQSTNQRKWQFSVPEGVKAFEFTVTVSGDTGVYAGLDAGTGVGSASNYVRTIAGRNIAGHVNGPGSAARFSNASGIAVDGQGVLYVTDTNCIRRIDGRHQVTTIIGNGSAGTVDGFGHVARLTNPRGVAISSDGTVLYIADAGSHTIRRARMIGSDPGAASSWLVSTIGGLGGTAAYVDNTDGASARFNFPWGLCLVNDQVIVIAEAQAHRIRRLSLMGGDPSLPASWRSTLIAGSTTAPAGASGTTDGNGANARFNFPTAVAADRAGNIFVADMFNDRIRKIDPDDDVTTFAGSNGGGYTDGQGTAAQIVQPIGIGIDTGGYLYVGDAFHRIRRISPTGLVRTVAGASSVPEQDGLGNAANLYYPSGMAVRSNGELYFVDGGTYLTTGGGQIHANGLKVKLVERVQRK